MAKHGAVDIAIASAACVGTIVSDSFPGRLVEDEVHAANTEQYVRLLLEATARRDATNACVGLSTATSVSEMARQLDSARDALAKVLFPGHDSNYAALTESLRSAKLGKRCWCPLPWPGLCDDTRMLLPGTLTMLCGTPGASKSLAITQAMITWENSGVKACALMLEDGGGYHLRRIFAQIAREGMITDDRWCMENADKVDALERTHTSVLEKYGEALYSVPNGEDPTPEFVVRWVRARAADGFRVIVVDPITLMSRSATPWRDDHVVVLGAKRAAEHYGCSIIFVSHPAKRPVIARAPPTLDDMSGGAVYQRAGQTIVWLMVHKLKESQVRTTMGPTTVLHNRTARVMKARNGEQGQMYALQFDVRELAMRELGRIETEGDDA